MSPENASPVNAPLPTTAGVMTPAGHPRAERDRLVGRARLLARVGLGWHLLEAAVAIGAGVVAGSIALVGFGADSVIEVAAGVVVLWLMGGGRPGARRAERRAQQLIASSFLLLAAYVGAEAARDLIVGHRPQTSWVGIALAMVALVTMPPLAVAKHRVGDRLGSSAARSESRQTVLCAYLSAALLTGLLANAVVGWWWADPLVGIIIAAAALREAHDAWRGKVCECSA